MKETLIEVAAKAIARHDTLRGEPLRDRTYYVAHATVAMRVFETEVQIQIDAAYERSTPHV